MARGKNQLQGAALAAAVRQSIGRATLTDRVYNALRRRTTPETLATVEADLLAEFAGDSELLAAARAAFDLLKGEAKNEQG